MRGFLHRTVPLWLRRLFPCSPPWWSRLGPDPTRALVISQVVLSFGIPQALIPLAWLDRRGSVIRVLRNGSVASLPVWGLALLITALNIVLLIEVFGL